MNREKNGTGSQYSGLEIAVIGMSCRFPGARNLDEYWDNLKKGVESISFFSSEELGEAGVKQAITPDSNYINMGSKIEDMECFDSVFFGCTRNEAMRMDPQLRIFLQCNWEALEDAGYNPVTYDGKIGVYAGAKGNMQWQYLSQFSYGESPAESFNTWHYADKDFIATQVSYKLNLKGPSLTLFTACSTSLVAIHLATRSILYGECQMALAGGVSLASFRQGGYFYQEGMVYSPDGHCRAFDARAQGIVPGDGAGVVLLKRLKNAIADNDHIYAVIKGTAINNDGSRKMGYTAPSIDGEVEVLLGAQRMAKVDPASITYVETHGTGTDLGDPIEIEALNEAFGIEKKQYCAIGSVKTNFGHLDIAAGVAGFIKTVLALKNKQIPPSLHFETPNPKIDFKNSPFYVNTSLNAWENHEYPLRAGVSSFGIGGTNSHVVLEEWPLEHKTRSQDRESREYHFIPLSAKTEPALEQMTRNLADFFKENPGINLADAAYTLQVGRQHCRYRKMLISSHVKKAVEILSEPTHPDIHAAFTPGTRKIVFMFPGLGAQYVNMGLELYRTEPVFRAQMDHCFELLKPLVEYDLKSIIFAGDNSNNSKETDRIKNTQEGMTALFVVEYSLARLIMTWGIEPYAMIGYSTGEYMAACLSGIFSPTDVLRLIQVRTKLMEKMPPGAMLNVPLSQEELKPFLKDGLELAGVNSSSLSVVAGTTEAIERLTRQLNLKGLDVQPLNLKQAYHSSMMDPILGEFKKELERTPMEKPRLPFISNVTGQWISNNEAMDPGYWVRHMRNTVQFSDGLVPLLADEDTIFVEIGPGRGLSAFLKQHKEKKPGHKVIQLLRHPDQVISDSAFLVEQMGMLWLHGALPGWEKYNAHLECSRVSLPTYPFEKQRFEFDREQIKQVTSRGKIKNTGKREPLRDWFYIPLWKPKIIPIVDNKPDTSCWLFLLDKDDHAIGTRLVEQLRKEGQEVLEVFNKKEKGLTKTGPRQYSISPNQPGDYDSLFKKLKRIKKVPSHIVHLWLLDSAGINRTSADFPLDREQFGLDRGFFSLLYLVQAVGKMEFDHNIQLTVISSNMRHTGGEEAIFPCKAAAIGPIMVTPQEYPNIQCRSIDIQVPPRQTPGEARMIHQLMAELKSNADPADISVAYRSGCRLVPDYVPAPREEVDKNDLQHLPLKQAGVYLVTGGLGGIGLVFAEYLFTLVNARLVLTGRSALPPRDQWEQLLETGAATDKTAAQLRKIIELEGRGARILVMDADVSDIGQMQTVKDKAQQTFGPINGIFHCAGILGSGPIQEKTPEDAARVLAAKVKGTLVLDRLFQDQPLDFLVLCSSTSAIIPVRGQVTYCAANAFLDAFAWHKNAVHSTFTVSINWNAWGQVGMAEEFYRQQTRRSTDIPKITSPHPHPLLEQHITDAAKPGQEFYITHLDFHRFWVLNEHTTKDKRGLIPGTAYLDMVWAAVATDNQDQLMELRDVQFTTPLMAAEGEKKEMLLTLKKQDRGFDFLISSQRIPGQGNPATQQSHVSGSVFCPAVQDIPAPEKHDLQAIKNRCNTHETIIDRENEQSQTSKHFIKFGPRWKNVKQINWGKNQGLALLELHPEFNEDFRFYRLHPALLDNATGFLHSYIRPRHRHIPFSYKRLIIRKPLPAKFYSYSRLVEDSLSQSDILKFNVTLMDTDGTELVDIQEYTMLEASQQLLTRAVSPASQTRETPRKGIAVPPGESGLINGDKIDALKGGIRPEEGCEALVRILSMAMPQVVVTPFGLQMRKEKKSISKPDTETRDKRTSADSQAVQRRPEVSTPYVAPNTDTEKTLTQIWQQVLGIQEIGIHDDFFELGGNSLTAIVTTGKILKKMSVKVLLAEVFQYPTIKELSKLMEKQQKEEHIPIKAMEEKEYYPAAAAQKRILVSHYLDRSSTELNNSMIVPLDGKQDRKTLENRFKELIKRHESLRTSFFILEDVVMQRVQNFHKTSFEIGYQESGGQEINVMLNDFIKPFDLGSAPLFRVGLFRINEKKQVLIVDIHHSISDGVSLGSLMKEFMTLHKGDKLPPLIFQYKDYSAWQNADGQIESIKQQEKYWLQLFSQPVSPLNLPYDYTEMERDKRSVESNSLRFFFETDQTAALNQLTRQVDTTLFMSLLALFNVLLYKLTHQENIVIGTPVMNRRYEELMPIIGNFINMIALRNYPRGEMTFNAFISELKEQTIKAFENQEYPIEELVGKLDVKRESNQHPLYSVIFQLRNEITSEQRVQGLKVTQYERSHNMTETSLYIIAFQRRKGLLLKVDYRKHYFKQQMIERFIDYFKRILISVLQNPGQTLAQVEILSEEEKRQVLIEFNDTAREYPHHKTLCQLFTDQVKRTSDRVALTGPSYEYLQSPHQEEGQEGDYPWQTKTRSISITYSELNKRAEQLACVLKENGSAVETIAAIMLERSIGMIIGILGILKSGAAYLPIEPNFPIERTRYMLTDSKANVLVTTNRLNREVENLKNGEMQGDIKPIFIESVEFSNLLSSAPPLPGNSIYPGGTPDRMRLSPASPASLAYIIYTSGSTGVPKGVMVGHRAVVNRLHWMQKAYPLGKHDVILQKTSYTFDVSVWELFWWSFQGASVSLLAPGAEKDPAAIKAAVEKNLVTTIHFVPSMLQGFLYYLQQTAANDSPIMPDLRQVFVSGEELKASQVVQFNQLLYKKNKTRLINLYGPTEATVDVSYFNCLTHENLEKIPIGKPIDNIQLVIFNSNLHLQPIGIAGELGIAGVGLARGYLNNPELTAEKFFQPQTRTDKTQTNFNKTFLRKMAGSGGAVFLKRVPPGRRRQKIYRTGDLACWLPDGNIEFKGRIDNQVKIRGFRVETGDIESQLLTHEAVKEAVVVAKEKQDAERFLCAFFVADTQLQAAELRKHLDNKLPAYMIPPYFVQLEKIPLSPNGKVNRRALPEPGTDAGEIYMAPTNQHEERLAEIWSRVLHIEKNKISIDTNFFYLGGHSINAIIIVNDIYKKMNAKISLADIFKWSTIRKLAEYIKEMGEEQYESLQIYEKREYYPLSAAQKRLYILYRMDNDSINYNMPFVAVLKGKLAVDRLILAFKKLIHRHESLRTSFHLVNHQPVQKISASVELEITHPERINTSSGWENHFVRPFDLSRAPLLRVGLKKIANHEHLIFLDMHHIISDGVSFQLLVREVMALYTGKELSPLKIQYKDFSWWQNTLFVAGERKSQEKYWLKEFQGEIPVLNLPLDYPRPPIQTFEGDRQLFELGTAETRVLKELAAKQEVTLYMMLTALYNIMLWKISGQETVIIGTPVIGREHADLQPIIGIFLNTLALKNHVCPEYTFTDFLRQVKEKTLNAFENQAYQFEELVEILELTRDLSRHPLFDVMFNFINIQIDTPDIPPTRVRGLRLKPYEHKIGSVKFDLTLRGREVANGLVLSFEYRKKLFKEETITAFVNYFKLIATSILKQPGQRLARIEIVSPQQKRELLNRFAGNPENILPQAFQSKLFDSIRKHGNRVAITNGQESLTYSQLENNAGTTAWWLLEHQVKKAGFIGIYMDNKVDFITAMLGILKAGYVFVPLDTAHPPKRIADMIKITGTQLVFADPPAHSMLSSSSATLDVIIKEFEETRPGKAGSNVNGGQEMDVNYSAQDPVYIYFTSGSTGTPKAILGKSSGLLHFVNWEIQTLQVNETARFSQFTAPGFDVFLRDILVPLCAGGTVCYPKNQEVVTDREELVNWINFMEINMIHCVPGFFRLFNIETLKSGHFKSLRYILFAGEKANPVELRNWYERMGERIQLVNLYGPTETTLAKLFHFICREDVEAGRIPIGKPIEGAGVIILDKYMKVCPPGIMGEIYIQTPYRTFGYLNAPQLNNQQFVPNPFFNRPGQGGFIYKTGDYGRMFPNGSVEWMGRVDRQIKVRGIRVELEEIENHLLNITMVKEAVVIFHTAEPMKIPANEGQDKSICAYIVLKKENLTPSPGAKELREPLSHLLPAYMIPSYFVFIEKIPLTANGKIDWKSLPDPVTTARPHYEAPRDKTEEKLVRLWAEVLQIEEENIGVETNFFEIGGHSLKAIILLSRIRKELNVKVPLIEFFKMPFIRGLADFIKRAPLDKYKSLEPTEKREYYALSSGQKRLYFLQLLVPASISYNLPYFFPLGKDIRKNKFESTLKNLIARHESLRSSIIKTKGVLVQKVYDMDTLTFSLEYYDISAMENGRNERGREDLRYEKIVNKFVRPFDLSRAPLLRSSLIKHANGHHTWLVDMHHIISDGTTHNILTRDFISLYKGNTLDPLPLQYKDFAQWQKGLEATEKIKNQMQYWLELYSGEIPRLNLPTDAPRPEIFTFAGDRFRFTLADEEVPKFKTPGPGQIAEGTLFMNSLTALNALFYKYTGQEDIIIGTVIEGRPHPDLRQIAGMFVNTLAIRNYPRGEISYQSLRSEVITRSIESFENQETQFEALVDQLSLARDTSRNPLFDVVMVVQNFREITRESTKAKNSQQPGQQTRNRDNFPRVKYRKSNTLFDMTFLIVEEEKEVIVYIDYYTAIFKAETVRRLAGHLKKVLQAVNQDPTIKLKDIDILSSEEKEQILIDFNNPFNVNRYPSNKTLPELFEEQAARTPHHMALVDTCLENALQTLENNGTTATAAANSPVNYLSYSQLNNESLQLAHLLHKRGIKANTLTGIMMDRSALLIVGIISILRTGSAFLPINLNDPVKRIRYMLEDTCTEVLITTKNVFEKVEKLAGWEGETIFIDEEDYPDLPLLHPSTIPAASLTYIIYTSGSTGNPKGVPVTYANFSPLLHWGYRHLDIRPSDRAAQNLSYYFDWGVWEIFIVLTAGASLYVVPREFFLKPNEYIDFILSHGITILHSTPTQYQYLVAVGKKLDTLKLLLLGAEKLTVDLVRLSIESVNEDCRIFNMYGPTEATIISAVLEIRREHIGQYQELTSVPIGIATGNTGLVILDRDMLLSPVGVVGELFIAGDGLAAGYLNNPELTAEKFILVHRPWLIANKTIKKQTRKLPMSNELAAMSCIYRTGDRARWLSEGDVEFLGRIDFQVKIRGNRIELGEIESKLISYPGIEQAVVLTREFSADNTPGQPSQMVLCAYIVSPGDINSSELRAYLERELPQYMIPDYFVKIENIPLNPNGKLDKKALERYGSQLRPTVEFVPPQNKDEKILAGIWTEILQVDIIGIHDNFFDLGGNSIKIIELINRIREVFAVDIPVVTLFRFPNISAIAQYLRKEETALHDREKELNQSKLDRAAVFKRRGSVKNG